MRTVKKIWDHPTILNFRHWLKDKADAQAKMKLFSVKAETEDCNAFANITKTKTGTESFASTSSSQTRSLIVTAESPPTSCPACKEKHPMWRCPVFREKTPTERTKLIAHDEVH